MTMHDLRRPGLRAIDEDAARLEDDDLQSSLDRSRLDDPARRTRDGRDPPVRSQRGETGELFWLENAALPVQARLVGFRGKEGLSSLYRFDLGLVVPAGVELDMRAVLQSRVALHVDRAPNPPVHFHGVVAGVELVDADSQRCYYVLTMVPELWHLTHSLHSRIFTDGTIVEIIEAVLKAGGIPASHYALRLMQSYPVRDHVCQYKETDLAFISRLMEREGLYYFFEQEGDAERLVITDARSTHADVDGPPVRYAAWSHEAGDRQAGLESFTCRMSALPAEVRLSDYDYLNPSLEVRGKAPVQPSGRGQIVVYGDNFRTPDEGERLARIRAEELLAGQTVYKSRGSVFGLYAGGIFALDGHPLASLNDRYLVTEIEHRGRQVDGVAVLDTMLGLSGDVGYRVELDAIPAAVQYRALSRTPWPRIDGVVDGVVDGPARSPYAQIDDHGRYKVRVFFDESDLLDGSASTWIRMLQPHGGGTEGIHFPLRKGTEVHIVFLGGDPDRPVIVGVAPNAHKPSKVTSNNHTRNVIMTGGSNRMELEDVDGRQYITTSTPALSTFLHMGTDKGDGYNFVTSTLGNAREFVAGYQDKQTIGHQTEHVTGFQRGTFDSTVDTTIRGALTEIYDSTHTRSVTGAVQVTLKDTLTEQITGAVTRTEESTHTELIQGVASYHFEADKDEVVDGASNLLVDGATAEVHKSDKSTSIEGTHMQVVAGAQMLQSFDSQTMAAPSQTFVAEGDQVHQANMIAVQAVAEALVASAEVTVHGDGSVTITSGKVTIEGGEVGMTGGNLVVNHGSVVIEGGEVNIGGGTVNIN